MAKEKELGLRDRFGDFVAVHLKGLCDAAEHPSVLDLRDGFELALNGFAGRFTVGIEIGALL